MIWRRRDVLIATGMVLFGIAVRAWALASHRSLWCDEAMLALNIIGRNFHGLLKPLDWNQAAPVGFLWIVKSATTVAGVSELSLRLWPFVCGVGCLIFSSILAGKYLGRFAALTAIALLACSETLIYYSNELKQYEGDALWFVIFVMCAMRVQSSGRSWKSVLLLAVVGATAMFCSHTIVFAMAGFFAGALILNGVGGLPIGKFGTVALVWAAAFGADYKFFLKPVASNSFLYAHWSTGFPPRPLLSLASFRWLVRTLYLNPSYSIGGDAGRIMAGLLVVCVIAGGIRLWKAKREFFVYLWMPLAFVILASFARKFPFEGRLITFLAPGCLITAAAALDLPAIESGAAWRWILVFGLVFLPVLGAIQRLTVPDRREELRQVLEVANPKIQAGDTIYVYKGAWPAFVYYRHLLTASGVTVIEGTELGDPFEAYERQVDQLRGRGRVWLITSHVLPEYGGDDDKLLPAAFLRQAKQLDCVRGFAAEAILFEM